MAYKMCTLSVNKCGESCSTIDDQYARVFVPNKVKHMNVKVFNHGTIIRTGITYKKISL